jgi:ribosomal protein S12 methylthiotransferase
MIGRSPRFSADVDGLVYVQGAARLGAIVPVEITSADVYDLYGRVADSKTQLRGALSRVSV